MSKLYVIPTPIGNLDDITLRSLNTLKEVSILLAEDTRKTLFLLKHFEIDKKVLSYHKFNEHRMLEQIVENIQSGVVTGLVSDAGTPGISDPGFLVIRACLAQDIEVECLPGATAFVPAIVASGLPCDRFVFEGFLPQKKGRKKRIEALKEEERTMVFYESPYRLLKFLNELKEALGPDRKVAVGRELTKKFEEYQRGSVEQVIESYAHRNIKGELVVVVEGAVS